MILVFYVRKMFEIGRDNVTECPLDKYILVPEKVGIRAEIPKGNARIIAENGEAKYAANVAGLHHIHCLVCNLPSLGTINTS